MKKTTLSIRCMHKAGRLCNMTDLRVSVSEPNVRLKLYLRYDYAKLETKDEVVLCTCCSALECFNSTTNRGCTGVSALHNIVTYKKCQ